MITYITSSPGGSNWSHGHIQQQGFDESNRFCALLRQDWNTPADCLFITAFPNRFDINENIRLGLRDSFIHSRLPLRSIRTLDKRNARVARNLIEESNVIVLGGGHVGTQHEFFEQIHLREHLEAAKDRDIIVIAISAGSMNSAETVYAQPEEPGESAMTDEEKFFPGLGLTDVQILPHYQKVKDDILDGRRLFEDITYADSMGRNFLAIPDGSFIRIEGNQQILHGEGYIIHDGMIEQISSEGNQVEL